MESGRLEALPSGAVNLDTVRSLHQTVVSLRTALELCKSELKELKDKYKQHSECTNYADVIEKLTIENHILRRKVINTDYNTEFCHVDDESQKINLEVAYSPHVPDVEEVVSEVVIKSATPDFTKDIEVIESEVDKPENINIDFEESFQIEEEVATSTPKEATKVNEEECSQLNTTVSKLESKDDTFKTKLELLSKFDVRIKVRTLKDGIVTSSTTSDTDSTIGDKKEKTEQKETTPNKVHFEQDTSSFEDSDGNTNIQIKSHSTENIKMAVPNETEAKSQTDKFDVQVRITSEENLVVKESFERNRKKDTLNLDVDDLSFRSLSEGDNSVFSDGASPPSARAATAAGDARYTDQDGSDNESEEVDDIELIFTTDESKDISHLQEDLVSIRESDWAPTPSSTHSTPVLIKFHTLDPDFQPTDDVKDENQPTNRKPEPTLRQKRVSLPNDRDIRHVFQNGKSLDLPGRGILKSYDSRSENILKSPNASNRRLDSVDSLSCDYTRGLSFDTKSSSYELGSSLDVLQSVDSLQKNKYLGHRFSVFAENDMSKCGISEDDLLGNLNLRRNTCPNPFQYRLPPTRGVGRPPLRGPRPVLRCERSAPRRDGAAQTDVSALPSTWTSEGYLARPVTSSVQPTRPAAPRPPPPRRQLLSDIGFTSMVPELSRSADPVWEMEQRAAVSKYLSRGSSRSPSSVDRSYEWVTHGFGKACRSSLPDVRGDDTDELMAETDAFLRRSIDNLRRTTHAEYESQTRSRPYIPSEARSLRLGHYVQLITPVGRVAVGRVRYVGLAGGSAAEARIVVGAELPAASHQPGHAPLHMPYNDGTYRGRRYFLTAPHHTAIFVPFHKVVMAWAN